MAYETAGTILNRVAVQVGLSAVADPMGSSDPAFVQMVELLTSAGQDILSRAKWGHLSKEATFTTAGSQTSQALPDDFSDMVDGTLWDRTAMMPGVGPIGAVETHAIKAQQPASVFTILYRQQGPTLTFPVAPADGLTIAYEYLSSYWVMSSGSTEGDKSAPTVMSDVILFDPLLVVRAVKALWLSAKGFDSSAAVVEYEQTLRRAKAANAGARTLSLGGRRRTSGFLGLENIPDTGYGA